jgi:peptide deformylase
MFDTMHAANGAGLAAPQIGVLLRVVIFGYADPALRNPRYPDADPVPQTILLNPELEPMGDATEEGWEGCLSVPGLRGVVERYSRLRYRGFDLDGRPIERVAEGFHARVVQHECDHLDGVLYPMRVRDFTRFGFTDVLFPEMAEQPDD